MKKINPWFERQSGWIKQDDDTRTPGEVDYSRVVHSASFRRLQGKTQVFNLGDSDFYRTRLTHSMEVSQIGVSLLKKIKDKFDQISEYAPPSEIILAAGLAHDLGHPPFGHGGEAALNYCMRDHGGFEGNGQSLRIASKLEKFSKKHGYDFTRRTLLAILKYPVSFKEVNNEKFPPKVIKDSLTGVHFLKNSCKPPKCYMNSEDLDVKFILECLSDKDREEFIKFNISNDDKKPHSRSLHKSFDCSIMDLADDISYGVHDLEDAIAMKLIEKEDFRKHCGHNLCGIYADNLRNRYPKEYRNLDDKIVYDKILEDLFGDGSRRKHAVSRLVHFFVSSVIIVENDGMDEPLIRLKADIGDDQREFLDALKAIVKEEVVFSPNVQHLEFKGKQMVVAVFEAISNSPNKFLPKTERIIFDHSHEKQRIICDYVAGMTDGYLMRLYDRLFSPRMGSLFDRI